MKSVDFASLIQSSIGCVRLVRPLALTATEPIEVTLITDGHEIESGAERRHGTSRSRRCMLMAQTRYRTQCKTSWLQRTLIDTVADIASK